MIPIEFHASFALAAAGRVLRFTLECFGTVATPRTRDHAFRNRTAAFAALVMGFQRPSKVPPEFLESHQTPLSRTVTRRPLRALGTGNRRCDEPTDVG